MCTDIYKSVYDKLKMIKINPSASDLKLWSFPKFAN